MSGLVTGPQFIKYFHKPDPLAIGTMVAVLEVGALSRSFHHIASTLIFHNRCLVTSLAAGRVGDILGRRITLCIGAVLFTFGGGIQTFSSGFSVMIVGRIISGFGVGLLSWGFLSYRYAPPLMLT